MFDKLIEVLTSMKDSLVPFTTVESWQDGLIMRNGVLNRPAKIGLNWHWPYFEAVSTMSTAITPVEIGPQSLISKDGVGYVINVVATVRKTDPRICLIEVGGSDSVIADCVPGVISELGLNNGWEFIRSPEHLAKASTQVRALCKRYGHELIKLSIKDLAPLRSYRLMQTVMNENHKEKEY